jgi:PAS domain S-box-containing protein
VKFKPQNIKLNTLKSILFAALLSSTSLLFGQEGSNTAKIDSLIQVFINLEDSPEKVDVLNEITSLYAVDNFELGLQYGGQALDLAKELDYQDGILRSSILMSNIQTYYYLNYFEGLNHLGTALEIAETKRDQPLLMTIFRKYGFIKYSMGDFDESVKYYNKAIRIAQQLRDNDELASIYSALGDIYFESDDSKTALDYFTRVYNLAENGKIDGDDPTYSISIAMYYRLTGDYKSAIDIYKKSTIQYKEERLPRFESYSYSQLAATLVEKGDYYEALDASRTGLGIANSLNLSKEKMDNYKILIAIYDSIGDYKKTYTTLIKYTKFKDSLSTALRTEQNALYQSNYEKIENRNEISRLNEETKSHELERENERLNRNIIIGLLVFASVLVVLMILRLRYINRKEKELRVFSLATNHSTNSIVIFDKDIKVEWVNQGFEKLTGLKQKDVKGKHYMEFYNGPDLSVQKRKELQDNFNGKEVFTMELSSFHRSTDESYWISFSVTPLFDDKNEIRSYVSVASDITAIHKAQTELQKEHDRTILLNEIGRQITSSLSMTDIIEKVYENVNKLMDAQNLGIGVHRKETNELYFPEPIEKGKKLNSFTYSLNDKGRIATKCFLENEEIVVGTVEERQAVTGSDSAPVEGERPNSIIYIPLISKWNTMGVLSVQSLAENAYGEREINIVRTLANFIAIALDNAGLYENMEERVAKRTEEVEGQKTELLTNYENTKLLSEIGVEISSSLEFEDIFDSLYDSVVRLMDAQIFGVRLYHEETNTIEYKYEIEDGKRDESLTISMEDKDNYSVWCVENDKEIFINDNKKEFSKYVNEIRVPSGEMPNSLIFYPMHADGKVIGVVTVQSFKKDAYLPYHIDMVKTLASYTSAAISNAALYDSLESKVEERTKELAQKNKDIMSSINYAKRIQNGILPSDSFMKQLLPSSFVFYRPRDIVSGDFYWVERGAGKVYFAVVDCTGHGVPGALMSIIGKNILDQAVNEKKIDDPSMILAFLRAGLRFAFSADDGEESNDIEDGMDLGICIHNIKNNELQFAGANINLHLLKDGEMELIKGDKSGVSASDFAIKHFTCHTIDVVKGDQLYLSSDGFPDQFGGERTKKFSQRRFQSTLVEVSQLPFEEQKDKIQDVFDKWKGEVNQLDDVCVMGVKL